MYDCRIFKGGEVMEQLKEKLNAYITDPNDFLLIEKAYNFALEKHKGQKRASGEDYIVHPIEVAKILTELEVSPEVIVAGFLHDIVEDCDVKLEEITEMFGEDVSYLVESLTKIKRISRKGYRKKNYLHFLFVIKSIEKAEMHIC